MLDQDNAMTGGEEGAGGTPPLTIEMKPEAVDAGAELTLTAAVGDLDVAGEELRIIDHDGAELARAIVEPDNAGVLRCGPVALRAPLEPGEYKWQAVLGGEENEADGAIAVEFPVKVTAHTISVSVWDVPPAIEKGTVFRSRIGIRCSSDCGSQGWPFVIHDHEGRELASGVVGDTPWEGTSGLHHAEIELAAPADVGRFDWTVTARRPEHHCPHGERQFAFTVQTVAPAEHVLTVLAVDAATGAPVEKVKVVAHPFRTLTDAQGTAILKLPGGTHTIFVSGKKYFPFRKTEDVKSDLTILAELHEDREFSVADAWA